MREKEDYKHTGNSEENKHTHMGSDFKTLKNQNWPKKKRKKNHSESSKSSLFVRVKHTVFSVTVATLLQRMVKCPHSHIVVLYDKTSLKETRFSS